MMDMPISFEMAEKLREMAEGHGQPHADHFTLTVPVVHFYKSELRRPDEHKQAGGD